jgi:hypothetical protein
MSVLAWLALALFRLNPEVANDYGGFLFSCN